ncbi:protein kinase superfamily protein [Actinidia rufa]|uniref:non-specific serine/threonine protein kinase n=1 Tax=Actinidia rufa TaxID=165716 RepID=A0A7J0EAC2_9ERIC|nr:protein kinase superfamily protein [Actinidia rufa]
MPASPPPPEPPSSPLDHRVLLPPLAAFSLLLLLAACFPKLSRKRTVPSDSKPPRRLSYSALRRATSSFSADLRLGHGGFGSVYRGTLADPPLEVAVKVMDAGSLQGEREFQNELLIAGKIDSDHVVSVVGFSSDRKRRRMVLVYELMSNGSLQDCLLHRKCVELAEWKKRFAIAIDIAKGMEYLHHCCSPPVIHGDIKPSNILLDSNFNAKIGDFGLARLKSEDHCVIQVVNDGLEGKKDNNSSEPEENKSVLNSGPNQSPESFVRVSVAETSSETEAVNDGSVKKSERRLKSHSGKEWWWKQDNGSGKSGVAKDYVMEWIGNEIKSQKPKNEWIGDSSSSGAIGKSGRKKSRKGLDWWKAMDGEKNAKREKRRPAREWWKEEYCEELAKKKKKKKKKQGSTSDVEDGENWWPVDEDLNVDKKKSKSRSRSRGSWGSVDWWLDGLSGELWRARGHSHDSSGGETPKSGGVSSTQSMRGTVCYIAPEYGGGGELSEKCDVYSFGVLLLVLIAGRRPLQVNNSPLSEFKRANLLSWARHLARTRKLLDLVDEAIQSLDREQALLCITIALLCLQKLPARRPSMKEVVGMLTGELDSPQLPVEFSPSPPSHIPFKSRKKLVR